MSNSHAAVELMQNFDFYDDKAPAAAATPISVIELALGESGPNC